MTKPLPPPLKPAHSSKSDDRRPWGLLPQDITAHLLHKEWLHTANLKARLLGTRPFPIRINLKAPDGHMALQDLQRFQQFIASWQDYPNQTAIEWGNRSYRSLGEHRIPQFFTLNNIQDLIITIGADAEARSETWQTNMAPLLTLSDDHIYPVLVKHLGTIEKMSNRDCHLVKNLAQQLSANMGTGHYLRALPIIGVDTKFLENHQRLITDLLDVMHRGRITHQGGLLNWLNCQENPKGWLAVRPLCNETKNKLGGLPIMQLPVDVLTHHELPASNILVVENMQSGLGLPVLNDTIAVFGGGKNVAWMDAPWLARKRVAYWGDIDTWGLAILAEVRKKLPTVTPLMMNIETINRFEERMVIEPEPVDSCPEWLNDSEQEVFFGLKSGRFHSSRLEQERLSADYIALKIHEWQEPVRE